MKSLALAVLLLVGNASALFFDGVSITNLTDNFFSNGTVVHTGNSAIKVVFPTIIDESTFIFFIEVGKGLFVMKPGKKAKLVLQNGKDIAQGMNLHLFQKPKQYIAATDGIYTFNAETSTAEKFGTLNDNIKNIASTHDRGDIFILTEDNVIYKVNENGTKKERIDNVKDAQQIALDSWTNLYFVDSKKDVYVRSVEDGSVKKFEGLPPNPEPAVFLRPVNAIDTSGYHVVSFRAGGKIYALSQDGTSRYSGLVFPDKLTAYTPYIFDEVVYIGYDKKIYVYTMLQIYQLEQTGDVDSYISEWKKKFGNQKKIQPNLRLTTETKRTTF